MLIIIMLTYYAVHCFKMLISTKKRKIMQSQNSTLEGFRKIPIKTLDDQKRFLDVKYPVSRQNFKFRWIMIPHILWDLTVFVAIFYTFNTIYNYFGFVVQFWQAILAIILFPLFINYILEKFNLQKGDLRYFLKY